MKIEVNIGKRHFFVLLGVVLLVSGGFFAYAFGGSSPSVMGHSVGEIDWGEGIPGSLGINKDPNTGWPTGWSGDGLRVQDIFADGAINADFSLCIKGDCKDNWGQIAGDISGRVVGGGVKGTYCTSSWGEGDCYDCHEEGFGGEVCDKFRCKKGTMRLTGTSGGSNIYLCIQ